MAVCGMTRATQNIIKMRCLEMVRVHVAKVHYLMSNNEEQLTSPFFPRYRYQFPLFQVTPPPTTTTSSTLRSLMFVSRIFALFIIIFICHWIWKGSNGESLTKRNEYSIHSIGRHVPHRWHKQLFFGLDSFEKHPKSVWLTHNDGMERPALVLKYPEK